MYIYGIYISAGSLVSLVQYGSYKKSRLLNLEARLLRAEIHFCSEFLVSMETPLGLTNGTFSHQTDTTLSMKQVLLQRTYYEECGTAAVSLLHTECALLSIGVHAE